MRNVLSISLAFALIVTCGNSAGQGIWSEGIIDCGMWVTARKQNAAGIFEAHLLGLLNGLAVGRGVDIWKADGSPMGRDQANLWMDNYCQSKPLSHVIDGAKELANEKTRGAFARNGEKLR